MEKKVEGAVEGVKEKAKEMIPPMGVPTPANPETK